MEGLVIVIPPGDGTDGSPCASRASMSSTPKYLSDAEQSAFQSFSPTIKMIRLVFGGKGQSKKIAYRSTCTSRRIEQTGSASGADGDWKMG